MKKVLKRSSLLVVFITTMVLSITGCNSKNNKKEPAVTTPVTTTPSTITPATTNPAVMKSITVEVVDNKGVSKTYNIKSDAKFVFDAIKVTEGLTLDGAVGDYGYYITAVNGITADFDKDKAYWAFYINGEYGQKSIDTQTIADGDTFKLVYEKDKSK